MILCSCNVLTEQQILGAVDSGLACRPRTPGQVYRCLGCKPQCGRCVPTVNRLLAERELRAGNAVSLAAPVRVGCEHCPSRAAEPVADRVDEEERVAAYWPIAAE